MAEMRKSERHGWLGNYLKNHLRTMVSTLGIFYRTPFSSLMTAAVLGIALALPAGLYIILQNIQQLGNHWDNSARISLFIKLNASDKQAREMADRIRTWPEVDRVDFKTREQSLAEFKKHSGFADALKALKGNPLPAVIIIQPDREASSPAAISALLEKLQALPLTDRAQLDLKWVKRLFSIMALSERAVYVVASLLALAVLLIIGNTIRLDILNRREEIIIIKLIGATNAFIRRPFLYGGIWYGVAGGLIAITLIEIALQLLAGPVDRLSVLFGSTFTLSSLDANAMLFLFASSSLLGLAGSWVAVRHHLNAIEPS